MQTNATMPFSVKPHLPLISTRIEFQVNHLPSPPSITLRRDLGRHVKHQIRRKKTPYGRRTPSESEHPSHEEIDPGSPLSSLSGYESSEMVTVGQKKKVPKPPGEAGRRNCGGFNLEKALGWEVERYNDMMVSFLSNFNRGLLTAVKKYVNDLVVRKLDGRKCFSGQKPEAIKDVIREVSYT